jgi:hypothetical protein
MASCGAAAKQLRCFIKFNSEFCLECQRVGYIMWKNLTFQLTPSHHLAESYLFNEHCKFGGNQPPNKYTALVSGSWSYKNLAKTSTWEGLCKLRKMLVITQPWVYNWSRYWLAQFLLSTPVQVLFGSTRKEDLLRSSCLDDLPPGGRERVSEQSPA